MCCGLLARAKSYQRAFMSSLQKNISDKFLLSLAEGKEVNSEKIERIRKLLEVGKMPKAEDFIKIFSAPAGGDVT